MSDGHRRCTPYTVVSVARPITCFLVFLYFPSSNVCWGSLVFLVDNKLLSLLGRGPARGDHGVGSPGPACSVGRRDLSGAGTWGAVVTGT